MHMSDALVSPIVGGVMWAAAAGVAAYSIKTEKLEDDFAQKRLPTAGVIGAFVFAAQMINFSIPGTGSSGHICGALLLSVLCGKRLGYLTLSIILALQALLFADGGLIAMGCNMINMGFFTCFLAYPLIYKPIVKDGSSKARIILGSVLASVIGLQIGAFSVVLETLLSGVTELPFSIFTLFMQPIHLVIGAIEGVITGLLLVFIRQAEPSLITNKSSKKVGFRNVIIAFAVLTVLIGGGLSLLASSNPDGLEWSIGKTIAGEELAATQAAEKSEAIQEKTAIMPDYTLDGENGTSASGIIGSIIIFAVVSGVFVIIRLAKRRTKSTA